MRKRKFGAVAASRREMPRAETEAVAQKARIGANRKKPRPKPGLFRMLVEGEPARANGSAPFCEEDA